jgi:FAD/FMN-containing dehydrogenase
MWSDFYELMAASGSERRPLDIGQPYYVLVEALGYNEKIDEEAFRAFLEDALERGLIVDVVVAASDRQRQDLWRVREGSEVIVREMSPFLSFDVSIEIPRVEAYLARVRAALRGRFPDVRFVTFGHLGDNNIHIGITVGAHTTGLERDIASIVYEPLPEFGGAVTAEHGIGQFKRAYLDQQKSEGEMAVMRRLRNAMDPGRIINPDVMF